VDLRVFKRAEVVQLSGVMFSECVDFGLRPLQAYKYLGAGVFQDLLVLGGGVLQLLALFRNLDLSKA
jgi:hypothetical protein